MSDVNPESARPLRQAAYVSGLALLVTLVRTAWRFDPSDPGLPVLLAVAALQALVTIGLWKLSPGAWFFALFVYGGFGILSAFGAVVILYAGLSGGWNPWHGITPASAAFFGAHAICSTFIVVLLLRGRSAVMWRRR